jgi:hypothetical protein
MIARWSLPNLIGAVCLAAMALGVIKALVPDASSWHRAIGGLDLGVLVFALLTRAFGHPFDRTVLLSLVLFGWGYGSLGLAAAWELHGGLRALLGAAGAAYMLFVWLAPDEFWMLLTRRGQSRCTAGPMFGAYAGPSVSAGGLCHPQNVEAAGRIQYKRASSAEFVGLLVRGIPIFSGISRSSWAARWR